MQLIEPTFGGRAASSSTCRCGVPVRLSEMGERARAQRTTATADRLHCSCAEGEKLWWRSSQAEQTPHLLEACVPQCLEVRLRVTVCVYYAELHDSFLFLFENWHFLSSVCHCSSHSFSTHSWVLALEAHSQIAAGTATGTSSHCDSLLDVGFLISCPIVRHLDSIWVTVKCVSPRLWSNEVTVRVADRIELGCKRHPLIF